MSTPPPPPLDLAVDRLRERIAELEVIASAPGIEPTVRGSLARSIDALVLDLEQIERTQQVWPQVPIERESVDAAIDLEGAFGHLDDQVQVLEDTIAGDEVEPATRFVLARHVEAIQESIAVLARQSELLGRAQADAIVSASILAMELEAAHETSARSFERANASRVLLEEFLASVSHELRTPLHGILSFSRLGEKRLAEGSASSEKLCTYFRRIAECGNVLLHLVNDLLDLSRLERRMVELQITSVALDDLFEEVTREFEEILATSEVGIELRTLGDLNTRLDSSRIKQVIRNLLSNAVRFAPPKSAISISIERKGDELEFLCRDTGSGIPEENLERVFERFVSTNLAGASAEGTGLGLAIARQIVEMHGGSMRAWNHPEGGAVFAFTLPGTGPAEPRD